MADPGVLTERQREVYGLRHSTDPPMSYSKIGRQLGCSNTAAKAAYRRALAALESGVNGAERRRLGRSKGAKIRNTQARTEIVNPELGAKAIDLLSNPLTDNVAQIARELGISQPTAHRLKERLEREYLPLTRALGSVRGPELRDLFGLRSYEILASVSQKDIEDASLRDKLVAAGIATDKFQLLSGLPTEIFSVQELQSLDELAKAITREIKRRELEPYVDPETQQVALIPEEGRP